jgi:hypothetical protein
MSRKIILGPTITPGMYYELIKEVAPKRKRKVKAQLSQPS